jgi:hypothetical protein
VGAFQELLPASLPFRQSLLFLTQHFIRPVFMPPFFTPVFAVQKALLFFE